MPACLQFALSNPVAGKEAAFNTGYGSHHIYAGVACAGILAGQRFQRVAGPWPSGKHDYLALWELDDPPYALEQLALIKGTDKMPISDAIDMAGTQPPTMWLRASVRSRAKLAADSASRRTCVLMLANAEEGRDANFEQALLGGELAALADLPGALSADLLTLADEQIRNNARKHRFGVLIELFDEGQGLKSLRDVLPDLPHLDPGRWMAPVFRPLGPRVDKAEALAHYA
jgi:hypothetical protein